ncbi:hypothetical protein [Streptomyces mirabilis]|uniref:hypothetical protein n=1 Tax=Streptomyces mirabilis TaxID=68239 RepID=UPI0033FDD4AC
MRVITQAGLGMAVALAGLAGAVMPAGAATSTAAHQQATTVGRQSVADPAAALAAKCKKPIKVWDYQGYYKCGTEVTKGYVDWNNDGHTDEVFVIAPDRTIWHTWKNAGGWKEMPGNGRADNMLGPNGTGDPRRCIVVYVNRGFHYWQNCFYNGKWHNWTTTG